MTGTITYILARAGWRAMNGQLKDERRRLAGAEPPAAYVSYEPRLLAGAGWYGYRISFKGGDRQMIERARYMLSERYTIRDSYEYFSDGVYVIGVLLRQRAPHYGIGGGAPAPDLTDYLNFTMPNGGTVTLTRKGSPTVVELEYSLDDRQTWTVWSEDGSGNRLLTLTAGQRVYVRNTSETQTSFSTDIFNSYVFGATNTIYAEGNTFSLLCKYPSVVSLLPAFCFRGLFFFCVNLITAPKIPIVTLSQQSLGFMFYGCESLVESPELHTTMLAPYCYYAMFSGCTSLNKMRTLMTDISATECLTNWLSNVSPAGDFYCPAELTIPEGASGIPSGWTRHDI